MGFPIIGKLARRPNQVPILWVRARNVLSGKRAKVPVSLTVRFPGDTAKLDWAEQPIGHERSLRINGTVFKGVGQRDPFNTYLMRSGRENENRDVSALKPFDILAEFDVATVGLPRGRIFSGGGFLASLRHEFAQAQRLGEMLERLGEEEVGVPRPVGLYELLEFPVISSDGTIRLVPGGNYFMNPNYMNAEQRVAVRRFVEGNNRVGQRDEDIAQAFMGLVQPAVYEYQGQIMPRIGILYENAMNFYGTLRDLLIERGRIAEEEILVDGARKRYKHQVEGHLVLANTPVDPNIGLASVKKEAIKQIMDEQIRALYSSAGIEVVIPESTRQDLSLEAGRAAYLREIRALNTPAAERITNLFISHTAKQLGVIHGSGGHGGGNKELSPVGDLFIVFKDSQSGETPYIGARLDYIEEDGFTRRRINWHNPGESEQPFGLERLEPINISSYFEGIMFAEMGFPGGGIVRSDNLSLFGFQDLKTLSLGAEDESIDAFFESTHPPELLVRELKPFLRHLYLKCKQVVDLQSLFCSKIPLVRHPYAGSIAHFIALSGGTLADYYAARASFMEQYETWRQRAEEEFAPAWFREIEAKIRTGELKHEFSPLVGAKLEKKTIREFLA